MLGIDNSKNRVIAAITLLVLAVWALRGHLPGLAPVDKREPPPDDPAALVVVIAMVSAAVAIIGFAIIVRMRDRRPRRPTAGELPRKMGVDGGRTWRFALIALGFVIAWLLVVILLTSLGGGGPVEQPPAGGVPSAQEPGTAPPPSDAAARPQSDDADSNVVGYLIPPMLVLMVLIVVGSTVAARRQRRDPQYRAVADVAADPVTPATADSLARAAEVGLAEIEDLSREPREAIIACYAAMERELMRVPGAIPQDYDTPSEVLARAVDHHALKADSATELVELFEEARFSPHVMTESHRDAAMRVLQRVLAELPHAGAIA